MDFEQARLDMIDRQLRPWEVGDAETLETLANVAREDFVPAEWRSFAYADFEVPLGHGAVMLAPKVEARLLQAIEPSRRDAVLEIGTGTGYFAALLGARAGQVHSVEIVPQLADTARANLRREVIDNVTVETGDGARGWAAQAPYDVIVVSAGIPVVPDEMLAQLKIGGRLLAIVGTGPAMTASLFVRETEAACLRRGLFETQTRMLRNAVPLPRAMI